MTSGLSLKLYLNSLVYHRNIFGSSSEVFGNLRQSSDIFGNFQKFSENVRERSSGIRNNFGKSSEIFGRWSETFGKSSKMPSSACPYNKKNITRRLKEDESRLQRCFAREIDRLSGNSKELKVVDANFQLPS